VKLDLVNLASNAGKVLYEDESGCRIIVQKVDFNGNTCQDGYWVWFRAYGNYARTGGQLVSGYQSTTVDKSFYLNPRTPRDFPSISMDGLEKITVAVSGLTHFSTHHISYWDIY